MLVDSTNMSVVPGATYARIKVNGSYVNSEKRALALFDHGITLANGAAVAGSQLPVANREPGQPVPVYAGGIGFQSGIVLSTGWVSDALGGPPSSSGRGIGMQGPNNGAFNNDESDNEGEIVTVIHGGHPAGDFQDDDFDVAITPPSGGAGEATGLEFQVKVGYDGETPRYPGFFRIELVHATDEIPAYLAAMYNDSTVVLINGVNILTFREIQAGLPTLKPLDLQKLTDCFNGAGQLPYLKSNDLVPYWPDAEIDPISGQPVYLSSAHNQPGEPYYDHEFGGFTYPIMRMSGDRFGENPQPLPSGIYTIKIVIQDQFDRRVDAAVFFLAHSLKYQKVFPGDFNLDGFVDVSDFNIWNSHKFTNSNLWADGDANFDGVVDGQDFNIWNANKFTSGGYKYQAADFNDDTVVNSADRAILDKFFGVTGCATHFEGDMDGDGDVDQTDLDLFNALSPP